MRVARCSICQTALELRLNISQHTYCMANQANKAWISLAQKVALTIQESVCHPCLKKKVSVPETTVHFTNKIKRF
jgi:hypothetical protein